MKEVTFKRLGYVKVQRSDALGSTILGRKESIRVIRHFTRHFPGDFKIGETKMVSNAIKEVRTG